MPTTPYDHIASQFHAVRTTLQPKEIEYLTWLLAPLGPGDSVLDLGCGTGTPIATHIVSRGLHILGVDGSEAMLAFARKQLPAHRWMHALLEELDLSESFHAIVCWDSLFHLPRRHHSAIIHRMYHWLRPGGRLMISSGGTPELSGDGFTDTCSVTNSTTTPSPLPRWSPHSNTQASKSISPGCAISLTASATKASGPRSPFGLIRPSFLVPLFVSFVFFRVHSWTPLGQPEKLSRRIPPLCPG